MVDCPESFVVCAKLDECRLSIPSFDVQTARARAIRITKSHWPKVVEQAIAQLRVQRYSFGTRRLAHKLSRTGRRQHEYCHESQFAQLSRSFHARIAL